MIELTELHVLQNISNWRESFHATYNGGHHDNGNRKAFHHGMDTVFNGIDARIKELEAQSKIPPTAEPEKPLESAPTAETRREPKPDTVNHPPHYTRTGIECIDAIEAMVQGWPDATAYRLGNVLKYLWRHKDKSPVESLRKAKWYLERELSALQESTHAG